VTLNHLCQFLSKLVHSLSKYRVHKSGNERHAKAIRCVWKGARLGEEFRDSVCLERRYRLGEEYMRDRSQAVRVNCNESAGTVLKFGVPQESVLGSKFFINHAENVSEIFSQDDLSHHLFADDMQCLCYGKPTEAPYMVKRIENCVTRVCIPGVRQNDSS